MARPARTAPITGLSNYALYVKANGASPTAFADTNYVGDAIGPSTSDQRGTQSLETSDRTLSAIQKNTFSISDSIPVSPDNANLGVMRQAYEDGTLIDMLLVVGADPGVGAKNYCVGATCYVNQFNLTQQNGVWTLQYQLTMYDGATYINDFNLTAWPSM